MFPAKAITCIKATRHLFRWPVDTVSSPAIYGKKLRRKCNSRMCIYEYGLRARLRTALLSFSDALPAPYMDNVGRPACRTRALSTYTYPAPAAKPHKCMHGKDEQKTKQIPLRRTCARHVAGPPSPSPSRASARACALLASPKRRATSRQGPH